MVMKRIFATFLAALLIATIAPECQAQYTTDWIANTFGTNATHVGNVARSMWVAPEGVIYTASLWDENEGGVAIYQNGQSMGSIGGHGEFQGSAITGNATSIFAALAIQCQPTAVARWGDITEPLKPATFSSPSARQRPSSWLMSLRDSRRRARSFMRATSLEIASASSPPTASGDRISHVSSPGALAVDSAGNIWVAQKTAGAIARIQSGRRCR